MKRFGRIVLIALPALVVGLLGGVFAGFHLTMQVYGSPWNVAAARVVEQSMHLRPVNAKGDLPSDTIVALRVADEANRSLAFISVVYPELDPPFQEMLERAVTRIQNDPRGTFEIDKDYGRMLARASRDCITAASAPQQVDECVTRETATLRARYCTFIGQDEQCDVPHARYDNVK